MKELTPTEILLMRALLEGKRMKQVAKELRLHYGSVRGAATRIPKKFGVRTLHQAVALFALRVMWWNPGGWTMPQIYAIPRHTRTWYSNPRCKHSKTSYDIMHCVACSLHTQVQAGHREYESWL